MKILTLYIFGILILTSCDCYQVVEGNVIDKETKEPLKDVKVYDKSRNSNETLTDSLGYFQLSKTTGGFRCPPMEIVIEHSDFETKEDIINSGGSKEIELTKKYKERIYKQDISDPNNKLTGNVQTLELQYIIWGCACANWVETSVYEESEKNGTLAKKSIFLEPANKELELPDNFIPSENKVIVVGRFYKKPDYPKGTPESEEKLEKAPVFRYTKMTIEKL